MPYVKLDEDGLIEEDSPCWNCENAYVENIWFEWMCKAKECPYQEEQEISVKKDCKRWKDSVNAQSWHPCMDMQTDKYKFCADGEKREAK